MGSIFAALALVIIGYTIGSVKIISQGHEALVERLGRYHRKLLPGVNFIVPFVDSIVLEATTREQILDIPPKSAITKDNISLEVDAVLYWRILELERAFYAVDALEMALENLVITTLRSEIGQMGLESTYSSRGVLNQALLNQLDEATATWGVKVTRVEVQNITVPPTVLESMERQRAAEIKRRAEILEAEGTVSSIKLLAEALKDQPNSREVLQYLMTQKYIEANYKLGESSNSKIIFMDPSRLTEAIQNLMESPTAPEVDGSSSSSSSGNGSAG